MIIVQIIVKFQPDYYFLSLYHYSNNQDLLIFDSLNLFHEPIEQYYFDLKKFTFFLYGFDYQQ